MIPSKFHTWVDGKGLDAAKITAERLNKNFDELYKMFDPVLYGITDANLATSTKILVSDRSYTGANKITGTFEFQTFPTVPDASIPDAKLSANVPLKDTLGDFTAKQGFLGGINMAKNQIEQPVIHQSATPPASPNPGQVYYNTTSSEFYGWNGSVWVRLDYVGSYTGGAVRTYAGGGEADDGDGFKMVFKTEGATPTVKIWFKGEAFPKRFYTELGQHTHVFTGTAHGHTLTDPGHTHNVVIGSHSHTGNFATSTHSHNLGITSGGHSVSHYHTVPAGAATHTHSGVTSGVEDTMAGLGFPFNTGNESTGHTHYISGSTGSPSAYTSVDPTDLGTKATAAGVTGASAGDTAATGTNANTGVNAGAVSSVQKLYGKSLVVKIDGTVVTSYVLTATGWSAIGDGTGTHGLHTAGTGEMTASSWVSYSPGFHTLEILEPEGGYGLGLLVHIETS